MTKTKKELLEILQKATENVCLIVCLARLNSKLTLGFIGIQNFDQILKVGTLKQKFEVILFHQNKIGGLWANIFCIITLDLLLKARF